MARAEQERLKAPFDDAFWLARVSDLIGAGFGAQEAAQLVQTVRAQVDFGPEPASQENRHAHRP